MHEGRKTCACSDEYGFIAFFFHKFVNCDCASYNCVCNELNALCFELCNFSSYDFLRETELRDTVNEYAARLMKSFVNCYFITLID